MIIIFIIVAAAVGFLAGSQTGAMTTAAMKRKYGDKWIDRKWWQFEWFR